MQKLPISVIMLTLNEEYHLREAIQNVMPWATEIFILDSCSTDRTVEIALDCGVKIAQRKFTHFGDQWNFAIENFPVKTPWTMKLDPDERTTPEVIEEIARQIQKPNPASAYTIPIRLWFMGKPLQVKLRITRLWRTGDLKFSDVIVNEHVLVNGSVRNLNNFIEHLDCLDLSRWMDKQNRYTTMEAIREVRGDDLATKPGLFGNRLERRMFFKKYFDYIPFRFSLYWFYLMFFTGVWRDGKEGRAWAHLRIEVVRMRDLKATEMCTTARIPEIPVAPHGDYDPRVLVTALQQQIMQAPNWERA